MASSEDRIVPDLIPIDDLPPNAGIDGAEDCHDS